MISNLLRVKVLKHKQHNNNTSTTTTITFTTTIIKVIYLSINLSIHLSYGVWLNICGRYILLFSWLIFFTLYTHLVFFSLPLLQADKMTFPSYQPLNTSLQVAPQIKEEIKIQTKRVRVATKLLNGIAQLLDLEKDDSWG